MIIRCMFWLLVALLVSTASAQLNVLVFADFSSTNTKLSKADFSNSLLSRIAPLKGDREVKLNVQDTQGNVLSALILLNNQLTNDPTINVIVVADNEPVTQSLQGILSRKTEWSSILFLSAFASSSTVCDITANPNTVCVMPSSISTLTAIFEASSLYFRWASVAVIMSNDEHGRSVSAILDKVAASVAGSPAIVSRQYMPTGTRVSNAADDAVIAETIQGRPVAVLLFVTPAEYTRIIAAQKRNDSPTAKKLFFLLSRTNVNIISSFEGTSTSTSPMTGAVFVPYFAPASEFDLNNDKTDEMGRLLLSYTFDSMIVALRVNNLTASAVFNQTYEGGKSTDNGKFSFDKNDGRRIDMQLGLNSKSFNPLLKYQLFAGATSPIWEGSMNTIHTLVPASPLRAVTVCMASPPECSDVANLARLLSYTLQLNAEGSTTTSIVPIPINTGFDGVSGLASFIEVSKQCSILTGPGRFAINNVFTPIINNYGITQIDYTTANPALSDDVAYPYFNRVIPSDTFNLKVLAATMDYFAWERVILLTTADTYGTAMAQAAVDAMDERAILVEQLYKLDSITVAALKPFFTKLKESYIGRVVIPLLPVSDEQAALFIDTWVSMQDKTTIFLFSNIFCQYLHTRPSQRLRIPSSICAIPTYNQTLVDSTKAAYDSTLPKVRATLFEAGFENVDKCDLNAWGPYSVSALDAAKMLRQIVVNASTTGVVINTTNMMPMIRGVTFQGITAPFTITSAGDRTSAEYNLDIQMNGQDGNVTVFGYWDSRSTPNFRYLLPNKNSITWLDGTNKFPAATIRSLSFIAQTTLTASPGTIVLSVVGFLGTFLVFGFCYRHYRTQRMLELDFDRMVEDLDRAQKRKREEAESTV